MIVEMPVQITLPDLIKVIERLPFTELDSLYSQVSQIHQRRHNETALVAQINRRLPAEQRIRLKFLSQKLEQETITEVELREFQSLIQATETLDAERTEALVLLTQIRNTTIRQLMRDLKLDLHHD